MKLDIDPKDVLELAAQKVADEVMGEYDDFQVMVEDRITAALNTIVTDAFKASMVDAVDKKLADEIEKVLSQEIVPVDIWGEGKGEPTTIREQLHKRALEYWEDRVEPDTNNRGRYRKASYGGVPRHKLVFQDVAQEAFNGALKENVNEMVKAFRDAMKRDAAKHINEHIDRIINGRVIEANR